MSSVIDQIERDQLRKGLPSFQPGDRVRVHFQVIEGSRKRTQVFEGVVIRRQGSGVRETFTVRKQSFGVGVERTFPLHSPKIEKLEVAARGDVRRAKLYYLRGRVGKAARVAERRWGIDEDMVSAPVEAAATDAEGVSQEEVVPVEAEEAPPAAEESVEAPEATEEAAPEAEEAAAEESAPEAEEAPAEEPEEAPAVEPEAEAAAEAPAAGETSEPEAPAETETDGEPEAAADGGAAAEAGETEDSAASSDAEDEEPAPAGDSDEDSAS